MMGGAGAGNAAPPMPTCMVAPIGTDTVLYAGADTPALYAIGADTG
jgi:hypothetical protein